MPQPPTERRAAAAGSDRDPVEVDEPTREHKDIEWDDQFEPVEWRTYRWDLIADQLRQRPGKWARE